MIALQPSAPVTLKRDADSTLRIQPKKLAALRRPWGSFEAGDVFYIVRIVECNGGEFLRYNVKCVELSVHERGMTDDIFFHRTLPAEYLRWVPNVGEFFQVDRNQGLRDASCIGRHGNQALCEYDMPNGRTYLFIMDGLGERSISRNQLPKRWEEHVD